MNNCHDGKKNQPTLQGVELKIVPQNLYLYNQEFAPKTLCLFIISEKPSVDFLFVLICPLEAIRLQSGLYKVSPIGHICV